MAIQSTCMGRFLGVGSWVWCGLLGIFFAASATAQYAYDPSNADEQVPGVRYFGSAKDTHGALLPGATIILVSDQASFVFLTDEQGRFRGNLPVDTVPAKVDMKCWKKGFQFIQISKRLGPVSAKPTVQVDCVLRKAAAS